MNGGGLRRSVVATPALRAGHIAATLAGYRSDARMGRDVIRRRVL
jgi:hypothetical protein